MPSNSITPEEKSRAVVLSGMMAFVQAVIQRFRGEVIDPLIPSQASAQNQLADKAFVNSSIATATATYRGNFNLVSDLELTIDATEAQTAAALATAIQTADNNDYCYVQVPTADDKPTEIARIDRYKHNGTAWSLEYTLNNSGFTAAEWAAINSGITSGLVAKLSALPSMAELTTLLNGKADKTATVSDVTYDSSTGKLKKTINGTTTNVCDVVASGFRLTHNNETGADVFEAIGTATFTHNDETGADSFVF